MSDSERACSPADPPRLVDQARSYVLPGRTNSRSVRVRTHLVGPDGECLPDCGQGFRSCGWPDKRDALEAHPEARYVRGIDTSDLYSSELRRTYRRG